MADSAFDIFYEPGDETERSFSDEDLVFTDEEKEKIRDAKDRYPTDRSAVMHVLWIAQEKFGWLAPEVIKLVAEELEMDSAQVYGVATFYTQYYKHEKGAYVLDVCTCFSCQVCGGYDVLHYLEDQLGIEAGETTEDGMFTVREVECLGACGSAPMLEVSNGPYVHNLTEEKIDVLLESLRDGEMPEFTSVTLPQDEDELGGNRRTDVKRTESYRAPPVSESLD